MGKTSLLWAGVVPKLKDVVRGVVVILREWQEQNFERAIRRKVLHALLDVIKAENLFVEDCASLTIEKLTEGLEASLKENRGMAGSQAVAKLEDLPLDRFLMLCATAIDGRIFFILDQFEEYFLYHPVSKAVNDFEKQFAAAVNRRGIPANFLISLREDGLSKLDRLMGRIPDLLKNILRVEHLTRDGAEKAIRLPLEKEPCKGTMTIQDSLIPALFEDLVPGNVVFGGNEPKVPSPESAGNGCRVDSSFLQLVLARLWEVAVGCKSKVITLDIYTDLDRANGIAQGYLDELMQKRLKEEVRRRNPDSQENDLDVAVREVREVAAGLFKFLVTVISSKYAPTTGELAEFVKAGDKAKIEKIFIALELLEKLRVVRRADNLGSDRNGADEEKAMRRYELSHDRLGSAVRQWCLKHEKEQAAEKARADAEVKARADAAQAKVEAEKARIKIEERARAEAAKAKAEAQQERFEAEIKLQKALRRQMILGSVALIAVILLAALAWVFVANEKTNSVKLEEEGVKNLRLAERAISFLSSSDPWLALPAAVRTCELAKDVSREYKKDVQVPIQALLVLYNARNSGLQPTDANGLRPVNPENFVPWMPSPDQRINITIDDGNRLVVRDEYFIERYSLALPPDLRIKKMGFNKNSNKLGIEGFFDDGKTHVVEWDLHPPEFPWFKPPELHHYEPPLENVLGIDKIAGGSGDRYLKEFQAPGKGGVVFSYEQITTHWLAVALHYAQPLPLAQQDALPFGLFKTKEGDVSKLITEQIAIACKLTLVNKGRAEDLLRKATAPLSSDKNIIEDPGSFLEETRRRIAAAEIALGDSSGINGSPEEAIYYYNDAKKFDSDVTEEAPEKLLQAAKLIGEGNKKMANGDAQGAKASYRAAKEQAPKHLLLFDPETGNAKQGPEQHVTTNTRANH